MGESDTAVPSTLRAVPRAIDALARYCAHLAGIVLFGLMMLLVTDIAMRTLFNSPIRGTIGYAEVLISVAIFLALAHTHRTEGNIRMELVLTRMPRRARALAEAVSRILVAIITLFLLVSSVPHATRSYRVNEVWRGVIDVPLWPGRYALVAGAAVLALTSVRLACSRKQTGSAVPDEGVL